jgi:hypothetical protein
MVNDACVLLWVSLFGTEFFNLGCGYFPDKAQGSLPQLLEVSYTLLPHSLNLRDLLSPQIGLLGCLWEVISLPFYLLRQAWIWTQVLTSLMNGAPLPSVVLVPHQVPVCIQGPDPTHQEDEYPSRSSCPLVPGGISSWQSGGCTPVTREVINHHVSGFPDKPPRNVAGSC